MPLNFCRNLVKYWRFSKFFHSQAPQKTYSKVLIKDPTTPQTHHYTTGSFEHRSDATCGMNSIDLDCFKMFVKFYFCASKWCDKFLGIYTSFGPWLNRSSIRPFLAKILAGFLHLARFGRCPLSCGAHRLFTAKSTDATRTLGLSSFEWFHVLTH